MKPLYLPSGLALFLLIAAPWHILVSQANPEFLSFYFVQQHFHRYFSWNDGPVHRPWTFIPVLLIGFFPWTAFLAQAIKYNLASSGGEGWKYRERIFLILWSGLIFLFFSASSSQVIPYILPMFPPLALLVGRYFAEAWERHNLEGIRPGYLVVVMMIFIIAALDLMAPQHQLERYSNWPSLKTPSEDATIPSTDLVEYSDLSKLTSYTEAQAAILVAGAISLLILGRRRGFPWAVSSLALTSALFLVVANSSLPLFDQRRSVKDLAGVLKSHLHTADEVVTYHAYYQDLPVYLDRLVTVVGWRGELDFGVQTEDASGWMIDDAICWKSWNGPTTVYLFTSRPIYDKLRAEAGKKFYLLAQTEYNVLLSNKGSLVEAPRG